MEKVRALGLCCPPFAVLALIPIAGGSFKADRRDTQQKRTPHTHMRQAQTSSGGSLATGLGVTRGAEGETYPALLTDPLRGMWLTFASRFDLLKGS